MDLEGGSAPSELLGAELRITLFPQILFLGNSSLIFFTFSPPKGGLGGRMDGLMVGKTGAANTPPTISLMPEELQYSDPRSLSPGKGKVVSKKSFKVMVSARVTLISVAPRLGAPVQQTLVLPGGMSNTSSC